ncbi:MAG TPA: excinuclease ABC subunit UvrC, partial [Rhodospirillales bacterium]|nr:excinuclease ABC subunit UvrC [Rhodospirillales bacterium]
TDATACRPLTGHQVVGAHLNALPGSPGVYRMINSTGDVLYVGKAKNLRKRVAAYTKPERLSLRICKMVGETASMEFVTTHTEAEALLLEANLIKRLRPRFNILLRDDKSFPYILATNGHDYPRVLKHRGARSGDGEYFGPFASAWAVNETLAVLQRVFLLRTCSDAAFASRTRPCLQYQIKRCSAPCVGRIGKEDYGALMTQARAFLAGKSRDIQRDMAQRMEKASDALKFEDAAEYRDRIKALTTIQARQDINLAGVLDADVAALHQSGGQTCIQVFFIRGGRNFGNRAYFPGHAKDDGAAEILEAFLGQFYTNKPAPKEILTSHDTPNRALIAEALGVHAKRKVRLSRPVRGARRKLMDHALNNARDALARRLSESASQRRLLEGLTRILGLDAIPARIEVYDNSHVSGAHAVGAMIVAGPEGMMKNAYRKFNIKGGKDFSPGDDYAMMAEVLTRRFSRALKEDPERSRGQWPDLVLIDGGKGQLGEARRVFEDLGLEGVALAAVSKGPDRNAGRELIHLPARDGAIALKPRDPVLYFIQRLRDEAHRFAIGTHRAKRSKALTRSILDEIPGIGAKRKKALLVHFGSARAVTQAGRSDLETVDGVSRTTAKKIYDWFHAEG